MNGSVVFFIAWQPKDQASCMDPGKVSFPWNTRLGLYGKHDLDLFGP